MNNGYLFRSFLTKRLPSRFELLAEYWGWCLARTTVLRLQTQILLILVIILSKLSLKFRVFSSKANITATFFLVEECLFYVSLIVKQPLASINPYNQPFESKRKLSKGKLLMLISLIAFYLLIYIIEQF